MVDEGAIQRGYGYRHMATDSDDFDFRKECVRVYRGTKSEEIKIKALTLLSKLLPAKETVKKPTEEGGPDPAAKAARDRMNKGDQ